MRRITRFLIVPGLLALTPALLIAEDATPGAPAAAEPVSQCLSLRSIRSSKVLDGKTIVFELTGKKMVVSRLSHTCPGLKFEKRFAYKTSINQLCSLDIITVVTLNGMGASCGLGKFEAYTPPEPEKKDEKTAALASPSA